MGGDREGLGFGARLGKTRSLNAIEALIDHRGDGCAGNQLVVKQLQHLSAGQFAGRNARAVSNKHSDGGESQNQGNDNLKVLQNLHLAA